MASEVERLQELYRGLADGELLRLAETRDGLTAEAQAAVDAEMQERGLVFSPAGDDAPAPEPVAEDGEEWVELWAFTMPTDAEQAYRKLGEHAVPVRMEYAMRQVEENGPKVRTHALAVFTPAPRVDEAVRVLRSELGLFPAAEVDSGSHGEHGGEQGEDELFPVGTFEDAADAELAKKALTEAGIWFEADAEGGITTVLVKPEDVDAALAAVEGGFVQADD